MGVKAYNRGGLMRAFNRKKKPNGIAEKIIYEKEIFNKIFRNNMKFRTIRIICKNGFTIDNCEFYGRYLFRFNGKVVRAKEQIAENVIQNSHFKSKKHNKSWIIWLTNTNKNYRNLVKQEDLETINENTKHQYINDLKTN